MGKLRLVIELDYDDKLMHGDDLLEKGWFFDNILYGDNLILHDNGDIGDDIGTVKVIDLAEQSLANSEGVNNPPSNSSPTGEGGDE